MTATALLGVDWGSSSLRVMRIAQDGSILDIRRAGDGALTGQGDFETRLRRHLGDWHSRSMPILLCGMVGSDRGWLHAPYVAAPAGLSDLAADLANPEFDGIARIVPGVSFHEGDDAEVMRGEETLIMGFLAGENPSRATLCLPGTHSKWVTLDAGRIQGFRTHMTGELRAVLLAGGSLATGTPQTPSPQAFAQGLHAAQSGTLTRQLFQGRARRLLDWLAAEHTASFLSGLLIGQEIAYEDGRDTPLYLVARDALATDYGAALTQAGRTYTLIDPEPLAARGLMAIARQAGLV